MSRGNLDTRQPSSAPHMFAKQFRRCGNFAQAVAKKKPRRSGAKSQTGIAPYATTQGASPWSAEPCRLRGRETANKFSRVGSRWPFGRKLRRFLPSSPPSEKTAARQSPGECAHDLGPARMAPREAQVWREARRLRG